MEPLLLKAGDVAKLLGLGRSTVFAMLAAGELPVIRLGRSVRVPRAALDRWVSERTQEAHRRTEDATLLSGDPGLWGSVPDAGRGPRHQDARRERTSGG